MDSMGHTKRGHLIINKERQLHHQVQAFSAPALANILKHTSITI